MSMVLTDGETFSFKTAATNTTTTTIYTIPAYSDTVLGIVWDTAEL